MYGMGPQAASEKLSIDLSQVMKITTAFFDKFKSIKAWLQQIKMYVL